MLTTPISPSVGRVSRILEQPNEYRRLSPTRKNGCGLWNLSLSGAETLSNGTTCRLGLSTYCDKSVRPFLIFGGFRIECGHGDLTTEMGNLRLSTGNGNIFFPVHWNSYPMWVNETGNTTLCTRRPALSPVSFLYTHFHKFNDTNIHIFSLYQKACPHHHHKK